MRTTKFTGKCTRCGKKLADGVRHNTKYCPECAKARKREQTSEYYRKLFGEVKRKPGKTRETDPELMCATDPHHYTPNLGHIMRADKKPEWCSDLRWRMELRRRTMIKTLGWKFGDVGCAHRMSSARVGMSGCLTPSVYEA